MAVQNGVTVFEVQHLGGWPSSRMVERYTHLSSSHLLAAARKLDAISYVSATLDASWKAGVLSLPLISLVSSASNCSIGTGLLNRYP